METEARRKLKDRILKVISSEINDSFGYYFSHALNETIEQMLESESRYAKLVDWIDNQIKEKMRTANCFSPADVDKVFDYTTDFFETFRAQLSDIALLTYFRELLLDERTSIKMRENIETAISKVFGISYDEYLNDYV